MHKLNPKIDVTLEKLNVLINFSADFSCRRMKIQNTEVACLFFESVSSSEKITDLILRNISLSSKKISIFTDVFDFFLEMVPAGKISYFESVEELYNFLSLGFVCVLIDGHEKGFCVEAKADLNRSVSEPTNEKILRGPKDGFTENIMVNMGLIRKRIKDSNLWSKEISLGRRTKTKVDIVFVNGIVNSELVDSIYNKLSKIDIDGILDSGYLVSFLTDDNDSLFPKIVCTERPDLVSGSLLEGKIAVLVENSPFVLVIPGIFNDFIHNPEDYYQKPFNATITRVLRLSAFLITLLLPSFYIALTTFNQEIIPFNLLVSIASERSRVPFTTALELIMLLFTFELLRESDLRTPDVMGKSISIVGALILGDAAVSAGIISPIVVIIVAITMVCGLMFNDIDVINACRFWRLAFILSATFFGIVGILTVGLIFITNLTTSNSFGIPYLYPFSPFYSRDMKDSLFLAHRSKLRTRPTLLSKDNKTRLGDKNEI